ncbi:MAG: hypothetical protein LC737_10250 [Chloroflexi bacterium]|nr:hypothetical protein [Chloroflexota bacterium]
MPRKIKGKSQTASRKLSRGEIILYVLTAIVVLSMVFGTIASAMSR